MTGRMKWYFMKFILLILKSVVFIRVGRVWRQEDQTREVVVRMKSDGQKLVFGSPCDSGTLQYRGRF